MMGRDRLDRRQKDMRGRIAKRRKKGEPRKLGIIHPLAPFNQRANALIRTLAKNGGKMQTSRLNVACQGMRLGPHWISRTIRALMDLGRIKQTGVSGYEPSVCWYGVTQLVRPAAKGPTI